MHQRNELERFLECLQTINRFLRRNECVQIEDRVITRVQWLILWNLWRHGERTIGQLANQLDVRSSTMSQMIDRLELAKLVYRFADSNDARSRIVRLTEDGKKVIEQLKNQRMELLSGPFQQLTPEEQSTLLDLMNKFVQHLPR